MDEYIEREAAEKVAEKYGCTNGSALGIHSGLADCISHNIAKLPAADVVARCAYNQVAWERDQAIKQLREDYGVGLGEKKSVDVSPVRHVRWIYHDDGVITCSECGNGESRNSHYCRYCGAKMDLEEQEITNADMIRAMSDEELAANLMCPNEMGMADIPCDKSDQCNCYKCLLDWLRQSAVEEAR